MHALTDPAGPVVALAKNVQAHVAQFDAATAAQQLKTAFAKLIGA
jgi:hypothetical protein